MTQAEYARHRGCSREAVRKAIEAGRITAFGDDKLIDARLADTQWARNTRARVGSGGQIPLQDAAQSFDPDSMPAGPGRRAGYDEVRLRREEAEAALAELKLAEQRGELVRAADVRAAVAAFTARFRDLALRLPVHLAPRLAATTDQVACHDLLDDAIQDLLAEASGAGRAGTH